MMFVFSLDDGGSYEAVRRAAIGCEHEVNENIARPTTEVQEEKRKKGSNDSKQ